MFGIYYKQWQNLGIYKSFLHFKIFCPRLLPDQFVWYPHILHSNNWVLYAFILHGMVIILEVKES